MVRQVPTTINTSDNSSNAVIILRPPAVNSSTVASFESGMKLQWIGNTCVSARTNGGWIRKLLWSCGERPAHMFKGTGH